MNAKKAIERDTITHDRNNRALPEHVIVQFEPDFRDDRMRFLEDTEEPYVMLKGLQILVAGKRKRYLNRFIHGPSEAELSALRGKKGNFLVMVRRKIMENGVYLHLDFRAAPADLGPTHTFEIVPWREYAKHQRDNPQLIPVEILQAGDYVLVFSPLPKPESAAGFRKSRSRSASSSAQTAAS